MSYTTCVYNYIDEIPDSVWKNINTTDNYYFSKPYLKAFEAHNANKIQFYYIIILKNKKAVSLATVQVLEFDFVAADFTSNSNKFIQNTSYKLSCFVKRNYVKILICGSVFLSGEHGIFIKDGEDKKVILEQIIKGVQEIINANKYLSLIHI